MLWLSNQTSRDRRVFGLGLGGPPAQVGGAFCCSSGDGSVAVCLATCQWDGPLVDPTKEPRQSVLRPSQCRVFVFSNPAGRSRWSRGGSQAKQKKNLRPQLLLPASAFRIDRRRYCGDHNNSVRQRHRSRVPGAVRFSRRFQGQPPAVPPRCSGDTFASRFPHRPKRKRRVVFRAIGSQTRFEINPENSASRYRAQTGALRLLVVGEADTCEAIDRRERQRARAGENHQG